MENFRKIHEILFKNYVNGMEPGIYITYQKIQQI